MNPKDFTVKIHGKDYLTVDGRLVRLHEDYRTKTDWTPEELSIRSEFLGVVTDRVLYKATVTTKQGVFDGHSAAKVGGGGIEGTNPFEVAETSAVGRALKHAGILVEYGPTVEEMQKSEREMGTGKTMAQTDGTDNGIGNGIGTESDLTADDAAILSDDLILATVIPFGKYNGKTFAQIAPTDSQYIEWLAGKFEAKTNLQREVKKAAQECVKRGIDIFGGGSAE